MVELLARRAAEHPDRVALVGYYRGRPRAVSYGALLGEMRELSAVLRARGLGPGSRTLVLVPVSLALYRAVLAVLCAGGAALFVDAWAGRERLGEMLRFGQPEGLLCSPRARLLEWWLPELARIPVRLTVGAEPLIRSAGSGAVQDVSPEVPALVTLTTGTTGVPRAVVRTHALLRAQHAALAAHLDPRDGDVDLPVLPIFVLNSLALGRTVVLPDFDPRRPGAADPGRLLRQIVRERVSTASGSPAIFERMARLATARGVRVPLRRLDVGGAPVFPDAARRLLEAVAGEVHAVYGSTEAEPIAAVPAEQIAAEGASLPGLPVGRVVPSLEHRILPRGGERGHSAGELAVCGAHVVGGDPATDANLVVEDGTRWRRTGDVVTSLPGGGLALLGRGTECWEERGELWGPLPVEARVRLVEGVEDAAVLPPQEGGPPLLAVVTGSRGLTSRLHDAVLAAACPAPVGRAVAVGRLPRDPRHASRVDRAALRELVRRGRYGLLSRG